MAAEIQPDGGVKFDGPPVPIEMQRLFAEYGGGRRVTGVIALTNFLRVTYDDGALSVDFMPVVNGEKG